MIDFEFLCWDGSCFYCSEIDCFNKDCFLNDSHFEDGFFDILDQSEYYDPSIDDYI